MSYSCSDFADDVCNRVDALKLAKFPPTSDDDPSHQAEIVLGVLDRLATENARLKKRITQLRRSRA